MKQHQLKYQWIYWLLFSFFSVGTLASDEGHGSTIVLPGADHMRFAGYYMAKEQGLFAKQGLDVKLVSNQTASATHELVSAKSCYYGVGNSEILVAKSKGADIVALAAIFQHSPTALLSLKRNAVNQLTNLADKRIRLMGDNQDAEILALLGKFNLNTINIAAHANDLDMNYLLNNQFDAFSMRLTKGTYNLSRQGMEPVTFLPKDYGLDFYSDYFFTSRSEVKHNPLAAEKMREVVIKGWQYALTHTEETLDVIAKQIRYTEEERQDVNYIASERERLKYQLISMRDYILPDLIPIGYINKQRLIDIEAALAQAQLLTKRINIKQFVYEKRTGLIDWDIWGVWIKVIVGAIAFNGLWLLYLLYINQKLKKEVQTRIKTEKLVRHAAMHDHLTGLPNRACLMELLGKVFKQAKERQTKDQQTSPALLFIDLDFFKAVNDEFGHAAGDDLLISVSRHIKLQLLSPDQLLARLGGDEFVVLLPNANVQEVQTLIAKIERLFTQPFQLSSCHASVGVSIGYCVYNDNMTADEMLTMADNHMYDIKSQHHRKKSVS